MIWILAGAGLLLAGLLALRTFATASPVQMAKWVRYAGSAILLAVAALLASSGRTAVALLLAGWALILWRKKPSDPMKHAQQRAGEAKPARAGLSRREALEILGLHPGATADEIRAAHRRLMQTCHPDHGGSNYLAARLNAAKDVLLS